MSNEWYIIANELSFFIAFLLNTTLSYKSTYQLINIERQVPDPVLPDVFYCWALLAGFVIGLTISI